MLELLDVVERYRALSFASKGAARLIAASSTFEEQILGMVFFMALLECFVLIS